MRIKLLQPYKRIPSGAVADFLQPLADQLIGEKKAVWVPQTTACKKVNAELYGACTAPIPKELLAQNAAMLDQRLAPKPPKEEKEDSKNETQASDETAQGGTPQKRNFLNF